MSPEDHGAERGLDLYADELSPYERAGVEMATRMYHDRLRESRLSGDVAVGCCSSSCCDEAAQGSGTGRPEESR